MSSTQTATDNVSRAEARVLDAIDEDALVDTLVTMIQIPSVTGTNAESELQSWHARQLTAIGFEVDHWKLDLDALAAHPDFPGTESPRLEGYGTVGFLGQVSCLLLFYRATSTSYQQAISATGKTVIHGAELSKTMRFMAVAPVT